VPNQPRTQHRSVRVSDEDWADLDTAAAAAHADRAKIINQLIRWYLRRPGAKLPARPAPVPDGTATEPSGGEPAGITPDEPGR
jgi:hypothetical protein